MAYNAHVGPDFSQRKPGQPRQEYLVSAALAVATVPPEVIAQLRPEVPQEILPSRFGYSHEPLTIEDVLNTDRWRPTRRSWTSGAAVELTRYQVTDDSFTGTSRNSMRSMD